MTGDLRVSAGCGRWRGQDYATAIVDRALEAGINLIDTADAYSNGQSEKFVGAAIAGRRGDDVLATKAFRPMGEERNSRGSSRRWLVRELEASLQRLGRPCRPLPGAPLGPDDQ